MRHEQLKVCSTDLLNRTAMWFSNYSLASLQPGTPVFDLINPKPDFTKSDQRRVFAVSVLFLTNSSKIDRSVCIWFFEEDEKVKLTKLALKSLQNFQMLLQMKETSNGKYCSMIEEHFDTLQHKFGVWSMDIGLRASTPQFIESGCWKICSIPSRPIFHIVHWGMQHRDQ